MLAPILREKLKAESSVGELPMMTSLDTTTDGPSIGRRGTVKADFYLSGSGDVGPYAREWLPIAAKFRPYDCFQ